MARIHETVTFYKRTTKQGKVYYARFFIDGKRIAKSTGCKKKEDAKKWVKDQLEKGTIQQSVGTFGQYAKDFFTEKCRYVRTPRKYKLSPVYIAQSLRYLKKYILPFFEKKKLDSIGFEAIRDFFTELVEKYKLGNGISPIYAVLRLILNYAVKEDKLQKNPMVKFPCPSFNRKTPEILTLPEAIQLLNPELWGDEYHFLLNLTAAKTGMREGELLALKWENILVEEWEENSEIKKSYTILVNQSFCRYGLKDTKNHGERHVPISEELFLKLSKLEKPGYLFSYLGEQPLSTVTVRSKLYSALRKIGIDKKERERRCLTFHAWRHFYVTTMREYGIDDNLLRWIVGHSDEGIQERYTHRGKASLDKVREVILKLPSNF